jgi:hypothetical protein
MQQEGSGSTLQLESDTLRRLRRVGPEGGALIVGAAVLGAAAIWGVTEAGVVAFVVYRLVRKRPPLPTSPGEAIGHLTESALGRIGKVIVRRSGAALAIRAAEIGAGAYFGYRAFQKQRAASPRGTSPEEEEATVEMPIDDEDANRRREVRAATRNESAIDSKETRTKLTRVITIGGVCRHCEEEAVMASNMGNVTAGGQGNAPTVIRPESAQSEQRQESAQSAQSGQGGELLKKEEHAIGKWMTSPATIGTVTGTVVLGAAVFFGALEAAIGAGAGYIAYRVLRKGAPRHG